ncbi:hypothetical protein ACJ41O_007079 [Fusarium nematophilum]
MSSSEPAQYFVVNPIPQKRASMWKPIFYRGDNPKYTPSSTPIARAWRKSMWNSFRIELGDGVGEVLENKRRMKERKSYERKQKFRKWFGMKPTPPKQELEELQELVDSDKNLIATFEKDRWASYKRSENSGEPPNKKKALLGELRIYSFPKADLTNLQVNALQTPPRPQTHGPDDDIQTKAHGNNKKTANLNLAGPHSGNLMEESIVFTCWIAVEAEHRLRYKILDLLEEIAESFGG